MNYSNLSYQGHVKYILRPLKRVAMDKQKELSEPQTLGLNFDLNPAAAKSKIYLASNLKGLK